MQTSLAFLSALGAILILNQFPAPIEVVQHDQTNSISATKISSPAIWKLELVGGEANCIVSFIPNSNNNIVFATPNQCSDIIADLDHLSKIDSDTNGDITLYGNSDTILAKFIESESGALESIWPEYPLITLSSVE